MLGATNMGMIFNTTHTNNLINYANGAFAGANFTTNAADATLKNNLNNLGSSARQTKLFQDVWQHLRLGDDGVPRRLRFWFNLVDNAPQSGSTVAHWIGQFMRNALIDTTKYTGIEFFAVGGPGGQITVDPAHDLPDHAHPGQFIMAIKINTDVVDNFPGHPPHGT
jgi:hypothetical protein